jgi:8-oxo-dGTP diphosphatase
MTQTAKKFVYQYPHPAVATDIVALTLKDGRVQVLLIERGGDPFKGQMALPGGFVQEHEDLDACARRELKEETGVSTATPRHFANFSAPKRDPRERVISTAYIALIPLKSTKLKAGTDAARAEWVPIDDAKKQKLAFDHAVILQKAREALSARLWDKDVVGELLGLMPPEFTLSQFQALHEQIKDDTLDRGNFRRKLVDHRVMGLIERTGRTERDIAPEGAPRNRPSELYTLKQKHLRSRT